jgi:arylformamidase
MTSLDTPVFPGYPQPLRASYTTVAKEGYASFIWTFAEHTSTHVDSPSHFFDGSKTIDQVPLKKYVGPGIVLDFSKKPSPKYEITKQDLLDAVHTSGETVTAGSIVLFYTGYTEKTGKEWLEHPSLGDAASRYLAETQINAIGFDAPSPDHPPFPAHKTLLPQTIGVYENLTNLDKLLGRKFYFVGAPLRLTGGSASPVRALALVF